MRRILKETLTPSIRVAKKIAGAEYLSCNVDEAELHVILFYRGEAFNYFFKTR